MVKHSQTKQHYVITLKPNHQSDYMYNKYLEHFI